MTALLELMGRAEMYEDPILAEKQLQLFQQVSALFLKIDTPDATLIELPELIATHFEVPIVAIGLHDAARGEMVFVGSTGIRAANGGKLRVPLDQTVSGTVVRTGKAVVVSDLSDHPDYRAQELEDLDVRTFACVPMTSQGSIIGTLVIADRRERPDIVATENLIRILAGFLAQEIELRQRESEYRLLFDNANAGFVLFDTEGRYRRINQYVADVLGGQPADFIGKSLRDVLPHEADLYLGRFARIVEERRGGRFEDQLQVPGGERWFASDFQPIIGSSGDVTGIQIVAVDVTERKHAEEELRASEVKYRHLYETMTQGVVRQDSEGKIIEANRAACKLLGLSMDQMLGKTAYDPRWKLIHEDGSPYDPSEMPSNIALRTGKPVKDVFCGIYVPEEDEHRWIVIGSSPQFTPGEAKPVATMTVFTDITERKRAQDELRRSEERRRLAVRSARISLWEVDLVKATVWWDEGHDRRFGGRPRATRESWNWWTARIHPADRDRVRESLDSTIKGTEESWSCDYRFRMADGTYADIQGRASIERAQDGVAVRVVGVMLDVTELKRMQAELRRKERSDLIYDLHEDILVIDPQYHVTDVNNTALQTLGLTREAVVGRHCYEVLYGLDAPCHEYGQDCGMCRVLETGEPYYGYNQHVRAGAGRRHAYSVTSPLRDENGNITQVIEAVRDVTELFEAQKAVAESEERYRRVVEDTPLPVCRFLPGGEITFCNEAYCSYFEKTFEELVGSSFLSLVPEADRESVMANVNALTVESPTQTHELQVVTPSGEIRWQRWTNRALFDDRGRAVAYQSIGEDVTERKLAEEEKEKLRAQLTQSQKMEAVGRLAGGVAHDFNNMLGVILGHAELIQGQLDPGHPVCADLEEIMKAAERSADLTGQLLTFARKQTVAPRVIDLNKAVEGTLKMLQRLIGEDIDLVWIPRENLWPVRMDPSQVDQVLANLCVNARDAIDGVGKVTIETENSLLDETCCGDHEGIVPGEYVLLAVSDTGSGMDRETLDHLFEPFFTTKVVGKGTGLGLATAYGVVKQNNGFINVHSEPGRGATFKIFLPRYVGHPEQRGVKARAKPTAPGHETILLVEDELQILRLTTKLLESLGYTVVSARTPGEAIRLAREHVGEIHLLLTDVVMPEMNGRDLAKPLLSLYPSIKRLFMSGYPADVIAHQAVLDEGVHFLQKPFSRKTLAAKTREALDRPPAE